MNIFGGNDSISLISFIIGLINCFALGLVTQAINESKGYNGGFGWGFLLNVIGIIVVACKPRKKHPEVEIAATPESPAPISSWRCSCGRYNAVYVSSCVCGMSKIPGAKPLATPKRPSSTTSTSSWRCSCGRYNAVYVSSCVCGQNKHQALTVKTTPAAPKPEQPVYVPRASGLNPAGSFTSANSEYANIAALKEYKALLDAGVISLVEFEAKKNEILSK